MVSTGGSFGSASLQLEIGLGEALGISSVEVDWPSTTGTQVFDGFESGTAALDRVYYLREGDSLPRLEETKPILSPSAQSKSSGEASS